MIKGLVYKLEGSYLILKDNEKLNYYYLQRNLMKKFSKYLNKGIYVQFEVIDKKCVNKNVSYFTIKHFIEISNKKTRNKKVYYSINLFRDGIKDLIQNLEYTVFIDFEFNMYDYFTKDFIGEIIEVGYCVCDNNLNIIKEKHMYLNPTKMKKVTKRTVKFLSYKPEQLKNRLEYKVFYKDFKNLIKQYNPHFVVWGKSDIDNLRQSFSLNNVEHTMFKFIDLSQVHVNYYNLKNTPGLFKTAEEYNNIELPKQKHNALEDALMTKLVFSGFKETIK
ncbi:MAG: exonuclease domain-containing protein [bacterium]